MRSLVPSRRVLGGVLVALLIALAWQLGERRGLERGEARASGARAAAPDGGAPGGPGAAALDGAAGGGAGAGVPSVETSREGGDGGVSKEEVAALRGERDMLRETVRALRVELERGDRLEADERAELALYRRIGADESVAGLAIDTLERRVGNLEAGDPAVLRVTLVQARGRQRVAGRVEVVPLGADAPELPPESSREVRAALAEPAPVTWEAPFDLRFFETLEIPLGETFPDVVEVRVVPAERPHAPFRSRFRRDAVRILD